MVDYADFYNQRIGTTLRGKWKIEKLLGVGGMAAVYVAVHTIGHRVAVKILHPEVAASQELRDRFELEAHAVNRFSHPGAVAITDTDVAEDGCPFLVMELLEGEPLQDTLDREGRLPPAEVLRIADELLDVLAAAHAHGIVHRDIKPDNLFLLKDGRLKVLDFGIARMKEGAPRTLHTKTGMAMGTITYMPPEQVRGQQVDGRADIFAVAATMFRLVTGRRIHEAETHADMLVKMASMPAPPLSSVAPEIPAAICQVVDCGLAFRREDRYPDALTMQADVRAVRAQQIPPFAAARAQNVALAPTLPSTATPGLAASYPIGDGPTRAEPAATARRVADAPPASAPMPVSQHAPVVPRDPTAPMTVPGGDPAVAAAAAQRVEPPTWVSGSPPASVAAVSAAGPVVQIVPTPGVPRRSSKLPWLIALAAVVLLMAGGALALGIHFLASDSPSAPASVASESPPEEPAPPAADTTPPSTLLGTTPRPPGKAPPTSTTKAPPGSTATSTTSPPATTTAAAPPATTTAPPPATATGAPPATTTAPPANTGKTPPGPDKDKDKGKKHH
ncbi:MAG: protein kinase [Deltaproteobacteria bacterium]|nr:protein kinase [Deltaproteobacteria bacterium]